MKKISVFCIVILFFGFASSTRAAIVTNTWTGTVDDYELFGDGLVIASQGDTFSVTTTYDTTAADLETHPDLLRTINNSTISFEINGHVFESYSNPDLRLDGLLLNNGPSSGDIMQLTARGAQPYDYCSALYVLMYIVLYDFDHTAFDTPLQLTEFPQSVWDPISFDHNFKIIFYTDFNNPTGRINGQFDFEAASVPLPAAIWLFGSGLIGLVGIRRLNK